MAIVTRLASARSRTGQAAKRVVDVIGALALLVLTAPVLLVVAVLIRRDSPGPALFRQERVGKNERSFVIYKFRTMYVDADDRVHRAYVQQLLTGQVPEHGGERGVYKLADDERVTRVGRVLRMTSVDEIPQLLNVLRGDMSLVGPRPALPYEVQLFSARHRERARVKPGLTGLWQVSGRSELPMKEALELDLKYVRTASMALDIRILASTVGVVLRGGSAR